MPSTRADQFKAFAQSVDREGTITRSQQVQLLAAHGLRPNDGNWLFGRRREQAFMFSSGGDRRLTDVGRDWAYRA